jgi:hypothetical protein
MKLVNLTTHTIHIERRDGTRLSVEPSGQVARVGLVSLPVWEIDGCLVSATSPGEVEGLPEPEEGVFYVVSAPLRLAVPNRADVLSPGAPILGDDGRPVACKGLAANPKLVAVANDPKAHVVCSIQQSDADPQAQHKGIVAVHLSKRKADEVAMEMSRAARAYDAWSKARMGAENEWMRDHPQPVSTFSARPGDAAKYGAWRVELNAFLEGWEKANPQPLFLITFAAVETVPLVFDGGVTGS